MENVETKDSEKCCAKGRCCGGKALIAVALLAAGGLGGYFCGRGCAQKAAAGAQVQAK